MIMGTAAAGRRGPAGSPPAPLRTGPAPGPDPAAADLARAAAVLAADPAGLGGAWLRGPVGPERDSFLQLLRTLSPARPYRKVPAGTPPARLFGGLDLTETLRRGAPAFLPGLLADAHEGWVAVPDAEGLGPELWGPLLGVMDRGEVVCERGAFSRTDPARFGVVAMDEARDEPVETATGLLDRLAFWVEVPARHLVSAGGRSAEEVAGAAARAGEVEVPEEALRALVACAAALGVASLRAPAFALRAARLSAALRSSPAVEEEDVLFAVRTVLAPRGAPMAAADEEEPAEEAPPDEPPPADREGDDRDGDDAGDRGRMEDRVVAAARAVLPKIPMVASAAAGRGGRGAGGRRSERIRAPARRGRVRAVRPGDPRDGRPLDVLATVRAAAPWQRLREREARGQGDPSSGDAAGGGQAPRAGSETAGSTPDRRGRRLLIRSEDLRVRHLEAPRVVSTVFVVDGSGSHAARRLAEAKGAVELLLAGSYVRRERVGLVIFRNRDAEVALPLTRSLARARRVLAGLPGGGGTPLAAGLDLGLRVALDARRSGSQPRMVVLTDGKANVDLEGRGGRSKALEDALKVARGVGASGIDLVVLDTSPRGQDNTERLAEAAGGRRVRLPVADARAVHRTLAGVDEGGGR